MLQFTNIEGDRYNPNVDNYLVLGTIQYNNTGLDEIQSLVNLVEKSHAELVMVETGKHGYDLLQFLENIGQLFILKSEQKTRGNYYLTVQKSVT